MTEIKLNTTRKDRDRYKHEDEKRSEPSDYYTLALVDDVNSLEDELARVRSQLNEEVGKSTQLDYLHDECVAERDKLREIARELWERAKDATWAYDTLDGKSRDEYIEQLRDACWQYRKRFEERDA